MKTNIASGATLAVAAIALAIGGLSATPASAKKAAKTVMCMGINSCKGTSACKTASNACKGQSLCQSANSGCKGQNACKGKGYVMTPSAKECVAAGGKPDTAQKAD